MSAGAGVASLGSIMMVSGNRTVHESPAAAARPDAESAEWLRRLADSGPQREAALARLHGLLVRIARAEVTRRGRLAISGPELDDLAYQAALDALALELASNRNAIYKMLFDARRKLRAALAANGYLSHDIAGHS